MTKIKPINYKGKTYKDINELADEVGVSKRTLLYYANKGYSLDEAIAMYTNRSKNKDMSKTVAYGEVTYGSLKETSETYGLGLTTLRYRLERGRNRRGARGKAIEYEGITYDSLKDIAEKFNISHTTLSYRIRNNWDLKKAIETPNGANKIPVCYKGVHYESRNDLIRAMGLSIVNVKSRIKNGRTLEEAIEGYRVPKVKIQYKGKKYSSLTEIAREIDIHIATLTSRLNNGWSLEEAIELKPGEKRESRPKKGIEVEYKGKKYRSRKELAKTFNISEGTLNYRLKTGLSIEEAMNKILQKRKKK